MLIALLPDDEPALGIVAFGLAGLGCSALLPLTISFGQEELTTLAAAAAGGVIAFYQLGYGIAAFGLARSWTAASSCPRSTPLAAIVAAAMGLLSFVVAGRGLASSPFRRSRLAMPSPSGEQFEIAFGEQRVVAVEVGGGLRTYVADGDGRHRRLRRRRDGDGRAGARC